MHKGQAISAEFLFSISILMILFTAGIYLWNLTSTRLGENLIKNELVSSSIDISDQLLKSPGNPGDWESNTTKLISLGLASSSYKLDKEKIAALVDLNYTKIKERLGIKAHEFYFKITNKTNSVMQVNGKSAEAGLKPNENSTVINSKRMALLDNKVVYVNVIAWK